MKVQMKLNSTLTSDPCATSALLSLEEGIEWAERFVRPVGDIETITLIESCGRVLAEAIIATIAQPPFDQSAMDGYAINTRTVRRVGSSLRLGNTMSVVECFGTNLVLN